MLLISIWQRRYPDKRLKGLGKVAREHNVVIIRIAVRATSCRNSIHNSAAIIDADGKLLGIYRKMHIPDDPAYYEKFYFTPGDLGFQAFDTRFGKISVLVCWDQWFPEAATVGYVTRCKYYILPDSYRLASR